MGGFQGVAEGEGRVCKLTPKQSVRNTQLLHLHLRLHGIQQHCQTLAVMSSPEQSLFGYRCCPGAQDLTHIASCHRFLWMQIDPKT